MLENVEKIEQKAPKEEPKIIDSKPTEQSLESHAIDTYYVGFPGQERRVAKTKTNEQIAVKDFQLNELIQIVERHEIEILENKTTEEQLADASEAVILSNKKAQNLLEINQFLQELYGHILIADFETITNEQVPEADKHLLVSTDKATSIKNKFEGLSGYTLIELPQSELGFIIKIGEIELVFIYAKEKQIAESEEDTEKQELEEATKQLENEIFELAKKDDLEITDEEIVNQIVEKFEKLEELYKKLNKIKRFAEFINSLDPEQNHSILKTRNLENNDIALNRLSMAIEQFRIEQEDKKDERGFVGINMNDVYR